MSYPHEVKYAGGLPVPIKAKSVAPAPTDARELAALTADIRELWRAVANLQEPSAPPDWHSVMARVEAGLRDVTKRLDVLEKGLPAQIDKAREDAIAFADKAVVELAKDGVMPMAEAITKRVDGIDARVKQQGRAIDETIRTMAQRHKDVTVLAEWQLSTACERLVSEFRQHVAEH